MQEADLACRILNTCSIDFPFFGLLDNLFGSFLGAFDVVLQFARLGDPAVDV
jgi:hypothetical protein